MAYLAGQLVLAVEAGAPNNGVAEGTTAKVKSMWVRGRRHTYVSAQAFRRWLRDTMVDLGAVPSPTERVGKAQQKAQQATTAADPVRYVDDDLFGYMKATAKKDDNSTTLRDSPFMVGTLLSVAPVRPVEDFGVMSRGIPEPVLHSHEFYSADLAAPFLLDLPRIGTFTLASSRSGRPNYLSKQDALEAADAIQLGGTVTEFRGQQAVRLPLETRRERAALLLEALAALAGGAKKALHYGDRTPAFLLLTAMQGGVNPFAFMLEDPDGRGLQVRGDVLARELDAWSGEWRPPVRVGWRPGFRDPVREEFQAAVKDRLEGGQIVIDHPRAVLTDLAQELRDGEHDDWFEDPARVGS
jgi:CRISPR-associated protein Cst2